MALLSGGRQRGIMSADQQFITHCLEESEPEIGSQIRKDDVMAVFRDFVRTRPAHITDKKGHSGQEITCLTNYIPVTTTPDWTLYQYHVSFSPSLDSKMVRTFLIHQQEEILGKELIFDGLILYLSFDLPEKDKKLTSINPRSGASVELTIKRTNKLLPGDPQCITLFNLCNRKAFQLKGFRQFGRHFYDPSGSASIEQHRIEIWPGYISAIRFHEEELLMCCEMSYKVLRVDTVLDFMYKLYDREKEGRFMETCTQILVGITVLTRYNNKTYRIDDILWDKRPSETFQTQDGTVRTLADYYATQYNRQIKDFNQPLLLSRAKKRGDIPPGEKSDRDIYLIPELCAMTGLTEEMRSSRRVMQDLAGYTRVPPERRIQYARQYLHSLVESKEIQQLFAKWSLSFGEDVAGVKGRVLPSEKLIAGNQSTFSYNPASGDWARECRGTKVAEGVELKQWVFVFPGADRGKAVEFIKTIQTIGLKIGMPIGQPEMVPLDNDSTATYLEAIKYGREREEKAQMVVAMVPNDNKTRYDAIKKLCCLEDMKTAMIIGYDVYQDSANRGKSVGAAVFSLNPEITRWYSQCALHGESIELIYNLAKFCENGLRKYYEVNGSLPERIFLFRDGCGDGQIPVVYRDEVPQIQQAIKNVGQTMCVDYQPKLSFIIVTKKVNTRFFQENGERLTNPPPGTVVDSVVTRRERYDFFLVPQCVRQGTVTPVSYNVILDESGLSPDQMQRLAYKLCHLYYNWQGTIRVPAPCQYAHKLAFLVGQSLHKSAKEFLADKLYFL